LAVIPVDSGSVKEVGGSHAAPTHRDRVRPGTDSAFYGKNRVYALGNTEEQTFMSLWSDGVPVTPLNVVLHP
jgi:hypothetical protein